MIVPVVLDVFGEAGSHYTTEVTLVNDGTIATPVDLVYRPAPGFGEVRGVPVVTVDLAARQQVTIPDVLAYLRSMACSPEGRPRPAGTLAVDVPLPDGDRRAVDGRPGPDDDAEHRRRDRGAFGLFYSAVAKGGGARTSALVPGLGQDDGAGRTSPS